ncbi:MAG: hypothetical protein ACOZBH_04465 [Patescibacteria group bacterium]
MKNKIHTKKWFIRRIGKRVFRDADGCECDLCRNVVENGIIINDKQHADYMYEMQWECANLGTYLNYRDKK